VAEIAEAMAAQSAKLCFVHKIQFTSEPQEKLADKIIEMAPTGMDRVAFSTGGSPFITTESECDELVLILKSSIKEVKKN